MLGASNQAIASMFGRTNNNVIDYFQSMHQQAAEVLGGTFNSFIETSRQTFHDIQFGQTARNIQALRAQSESIFNQDVITAVGYIDDLQQAEGTNLRVIMCAPTVREMYQNGDIYGYGEAYVDASPGGVASGHYDYRTFTNGLVWWNGEEGEDSRTELRNYFESVREEHSYSVYDKANFMQTIRTAEKIATDSVYDLTDPDNGLV